MRLAGEANWWAPKPLRRFYQRFGFSEIEPPAVVVPADASELTKEPVEVG
jgi:RND superfamily putative drug exporter